MQKTDCAYLAGLIDADGSIGMEYFGGHRTATVKVHLTNRDRGTLEEMQALWGGRIYEIEPEYSQMKPLPCARGLEQQ